MDKSTIKTSRKIYAMKVSFVMIAFLTLVYGGLILFGAAVDPIVFVTALGAIGTVAGALNIADGMKGHEHD
jgi:uncharacterized membrane protein HdeD (DUF308 family)